MSVVYKVLKHLEEISKWSNVYDFLIVNGHIPNSNEKLKKKNLLDSETKDICLLLYLNHKMDDEIFTIRSLAKTITSDSDQSLDAGIKKVNRWLELIKGYGLVDSYTAPHRGNVTCTRIEPTKLLIVFIEHEYFSGDE